MAGGSLRALGAIRYLRSHHDYSRTVVLLLMHIWSNRSELQIIKLAEQIGLKYDEAERSCAHVSQTCHVVENLC
jgi:hypothetical protein